MDNKKKCSKCGNEFTPEEFITHSTICSYAFNQDDYLNLIPCELCDELINIEDYQEHITNCSRRMSFNFSQPSNIGNITNEINNDPIARALFGVMVGNVPSFASAPLQQQINNIQENNVLVNPDTEHNNEQGIDRVYDENTDIDQIHIQDTEQIPMQDTEQIPNPLSQTNNIIFTSNINNGNGTNHQNLLQMLDNIIQNMPSANIEYLDNHIPQHHLNLDNYEDLSNLNDVEVGVSNIDMISRLSFDEVECPICCSKCLLSRITKCGHSFCDGCLSEWLNTSKKCPSCMVDLE